MDYLYVFMIVVLSSLLKKKTYNKREIDWGKTPLKLVARNFQQLHSTNRPRADFTRLLSFSIVFVMRSMCELRTLCDTCGGQYSTRVCKSMRVSVSCWLSKMACSILKGLKNSRGSLDKKKSIGQNPTKFGRQQRRHEHRCAMSCLYDVVVVTRRHPACGVDD